MQSVFLEGGGVNNPNFRGISRSDLLENTKQMVVAGMSADRFQQQNGHRHDSIPSVGKKSLPANGKKTKGRVKIKMEFIDNKLRRYTTFSKRKTGIMKKAYELSTLTGTQVMLLVASETGHVYTFATRKLQPMITSEAGKALIQTCLNSPDLPNGPGGLDQRMSATGFEETDLTYSVPEDCDKMSDSPDEAPSVYTSELSPTSLSMTNPLLPPSFVSFGSSEHMGSNSNKFTMSTSPSPPTSAPPSTPTISSAANTKNQSGTGGGSSNQNSSLPVVQNSSIVPGSVVLPQTILQTNNSAVLYHTGQGLVYATPANLPDGMVLNLGQEQGGSQQQFITIPVSLSLSPAQQQQLAQGAQIAANQSTSFSSSASKKPRK